VKIQSIITRVRKGTADNTAHKNKLFHPAMRKVSGTLQKRRIKMALQWIKTFCPCCKKVVRFEFIGIMKGKTKTLNLFNCSECHTTRHFSSFNTEAEKPQPVPSL